MKDDSRMSLGSAYVFIVDHSAVSRQYLTELLENDKNSLESKIKVIGTAPNGEIALEKLKFPRYTPDVFLIEVDLPEMDAFELAKHIHDTLPIPVIFLSKMTRSGVKKVKKPLSWRGIAVFESGLVEFVQKPEITNKEGVRRFQRELIKKIQILSKSRLMEASSGFDFRAFLREEEAAPSSSTTQRRPSRVMMDRLICIGASMGGSRAISILFTKMPSRTPPILIVQHLPPEFTQLWVSRLQQLHPHLSIKIAENGEFLKPNQIYIAPGGKHCIIKPNKQIHTFLGERVYNLRPAIDVTFISVARARYRQNVLAIILTGLGKDGVKGVSRIKAAGGQVIAEAESTAIIFGMPRAVIEANLADKVLPLHEIPSLIRQWI